MRDNPWNRHGRSGKTAGNVPDRGVVEHAPCLEPGLSRMFRRAPCRKRRLSRTLRSRRGRVRGPGRPTGGNGPHSCGLSRRAAPQWFPQAARGSHARRPGANADQKRRVSGRFRKPGDLSGRKLKEIAVSGRFRKLRGPESPRILRNRPDRRTTLQDRPDTPLPEALRQPWSPFGRQRAGCRRLLHAGPCIRTPSVTGNG